MSAAQPAPSPVMRLAWREPGEVARAVAGRPGAVALISDGGPHGRWSYVAAEPERVERLGPGDPRDGLALLRELLGPRRPAPAGGPPFQGGVIGLAAYEFGARLEDLQLARDPDWPDLTLARYGAVLAFDHARGEAWACGDPARAETWLALEAESGCVPAPLADAFEDSAGPDRYEAAVAEVVRRIAAGEIFQANIARTWSGVLAEGAGPESLLRRLAAASPAPFAAFWRDGDLALVSNSPERFVSLAPDPARRLIAETRPIKGTAPRGAGPAADRALAESLLASEKDRAENLMIVDLMRNDLARVCAPGSVTTAGLFEIETYANVHHLVSTVRGRLAEGRDAADLLRAAFPPGSITGAPKVQAMKVIAAHEPPRGPWCGSLFWCGFDGAMDSSVLIRTAALVRRDGRWRVRACAGAGIVADSDPVAERLETEAKISALRRALTEPVS